jgi:hypothetical protein
VIAGNGRGIARGADRNPGPVLKEVAPAAPMREPPAMKGRAPLLAALLLPLLCACSSLAPFQTAAPNVPAAPPPVADALPIFGVTTTTPENMLSDSDSTVETPAPGIEHTPQASAAPIAMGPTGDPLKPSQVAICYNRLSASPGEISDNARQACFGATPRLTGQGWDLDACPLLMPVRAVFACDRP